MKNLTCQIKINHTSYRTLNTPVMSPKRSLSATQTHPDYFVKLDLEISSYLQSSPLLAATGLFNSSIIFYWNG